MIARIAIAQSTYSSVYGLPRSRLSTPPPDAKSTSKGPASSHSIPTRRAAERMRSPQSALVARHRCFVACPTGACPRAWRERSFLHPWQRYAHAIARPCWGRCVAPARPRLSTILGLAEGGCVLDAAPRRCNHERAAAPRAPYARLTPNECVRPAAWSPSASGRFIGPSFRCHFPDGVLATTLREGQSARGELPDTGFPRKFLSYEVGLVVVIAVVPQRWLCFHHVAHLLPELVEGFRPLPSQLANRRQGRCELLLARVRGARQAASGNRRGSASRASPAC